MYRCIALIAAAVAATGSPAKAIDEVLIESVINVATNAQGQPANGRSSNPIFSPNGKLVTFTSAATNLAGNVQAQILNVFVKDLTDGSVRLVSRGLSGQPSNGSSGGAVFSPDGTKIAFESTASNLVEGDTNNKSDIFLANLVTGTIKRLSTRSRIVQANSDSFGPQFTQDGRYILFTTSASNLLPYKDISARHIIKKSLSSGTTSCVSCSVNNKMGQGYATAISPDGVRVGFISRSTFLGADNSLRAPNVYVKNLVTGKTTNATSLREGQYNAIAMAPGGKYVAGLTSSKGNKGYFYGNGKLRLVRTSTREDLVIDTPFIEDRLPPQKLIFSSDGKVLLSMCNEIKLHFFSKTGDRLVLNGGGSISKWSSQEFQGFEGVDMTDDASQIIYAGPYPKIAPDQIDAADGIYLIRWKRSGTVQ